MANKLKVILALCISAFLILTIAKGIILCLLFFFPRPESTFYGYDRSFSSISSLLFVGFTSNRIILEGLIVAMPFVFFTIQFFNNDVLKNRKRSVLVYAFFSSLLLTALWLIKELLFLIGKDANDILFKWIDIKDEFVVVLSLSFLVYVLLLFPLSKQIFKSHSSQ
ncbi:hypothetical protein [Pinibacter aurantiacus]|uniref:Uncharacterized protein n=1 Tax=Pinibacter aurantiacus TaxID=2851599 RepID=A0A9E2S4P0_9BACT|nr:hypothetical protein [Pinibacter aurantiacus]MBV4355557.1 hypothetical protein [Pinibacter aurantiacus]